MVEYYLYPIFFFSVITDKRLFTLITFLLISSSNDASADIVEDEGGSFEFPPKAEFTSPLYVHITLQQTLKQQHPALHN